MRSSLRLLVSVAFGAALIASTASADTGPHIAWNDCAGFGQSYQAFACNTNVGIHTAVGSFTSPYPIDQYVGIEVTLSLHAPGTTLPSWWQVRGPGQCRDQAAVTNGDFTLGPFNCYDFWQGQAVGGIANLDLDYYGPGSARIRLVLAIAAPTTPLPAGVETYAYNLVIRNIKTVGTACIGCDHPLGIVVNSYRLVQPAGSPSGDLTLEPNGGAYESIAWQCPGRYSCGDGPGGTCAWIADCTTEAGRKTWGAVKSLYR